MWAEGGLCKGKELHDKPCGYNILVWQNVILPLRIAFAS